MSDKHPGKIGFFFPTEFIPQFCMLLSLAMRQRKLPDELKTALRAEMQKLEEYYDEEEKG